MKMSVYQALVSTTVSVKSALILMSASVQRTGAERTATVSALVMLSGWGNKCLLRTQFHIQRLVESVNIG